MNKCKETFELSFFIGKFVHYKGTSKNTTYITHVIAGMTRNLFVSMGF